MPLSSLTRSHFLGPPRRFPGSILWWKFHARTSSLSLTTNKQRHAASTLVTCPTLTVHLRDLTFSHIHISLRVCLIIITRNYIHTLPLHVVTCGWHLFGLVFALLNHFGKELFRSRRFAHLCYTLLVCHFRHSFIVECVFELAGFWRLPVGSVSLTNWCEYVRQRKCNNKSNSICRLKICSEVNGFEYIHIFRDYLHNYEWNECFKKLFMPTLIYLLLMVSRDPKS